MPTNSIKFSCTAALMLGAVALASPPVGAAPPVGPASAHNLQAISDSVPVENVQFRRRGVGIGLGVGAAILGGAVIGRALAGPGYYGGRYYGGGYNDGGYYDGGYAARRSYYAPAPVYAAPAYRGDDTTAYCLSRFRSYDPRSGTYLGYDGYRHPCP